MKRIVLSLLLSAVCFFAYSQDSTEIKRAAALEKEKYWLNWIKDLYEVGVEQTADSVKISPEVKKIILNKEYNKTIFPEQYSLQEAVALYKKLEIKKAIWYLINIYNETQIKQLKDDILRLILPFEKGLEMDKILVSSFYTYAMIDPAVAAYKNGKIQILRPDILEQKFNTVKELISYVRAQRKNPNDNASKAIGLEKSKELEELGKNIKKVN